MQACFLPTTAHSYVLLYPPPAAQDNEALPVICMANHNCRKAIIYDFLRKSQYLQYKYWRAVEGSDGSAAGGRVSDLSEWQRSADDAAA